MPGENVISLLTGVDGSTRQRQATEVTSESDGSGHGWRGSADTSRDAQFEHEVSGAQKLPATRVQSVADNSADSALLDR